MMKKRTYPLLLALLACALTFGLLSKAEEPTTTPAPTEQVAPAEATAPTAEAVVSAAEEPPAAPAEGTASPLAAIYLSVTALSLAVLPVTGWLKSHVAALANFKTQTFSWVVGLALAWTGYAAQLGIFYEAGPIWTCLYGLAAAFTANALATTELVGFVLEIIGARVAKNK
jgi:hypothetical protein